MKLLIAYDGSKDAKAALRAAGRQGLGDRAVARILAVAETADAGTSASAEAPDPTPDGFAARVRHSLSERAHQMAQEGAALLSRHHPGWVVTQEHALGDARAALCEAAESFGADLVLVGSRGHGVLRRALLGSVSQHLVHHCPCSVLVGRERADVEHTPARPTRVLVCVDGSSGSKAAVKEVARRPWPAGSEFVTLAVAAAPYPMVAGIPEPALITVPESYSLATREWAVETSENAAAQLAGAGLQAKAATTEGSPSPRILDRAEEMQADSIFLGARGHGRLHRLLLGSVAGAVAAGAHCSVELIRGEATEAAMSETQAPG